MAARDQVRGEDYAAGCAARRCRSRFQDRQRNRERSLWRGWRVWKRSLDAYEIDVFLKWLAREMGESKSELYRELQRERARRR